jgi:hypothetical protein
MQRYPRPTSGIQAGLALPGTTGRFRRVRITPQHKKTPEYDTAKQCRAFVELFGTKNETSSIVISLSDLWL